MLHFQKREMEQKREDVWSSKTFEKMSCDVCGQEDGKRCAGCGSVAYCGRECQREGWKKHKRFCTRRKLGQDLTGLTGSVEMI